VRVKQRRTKLSKGVGLFLWENMCNVREIITEKPDVIVSNDSYMCLFSCIYCWVRKKKFIYDHNDNWLEVEKSILLKRYLRWVFYPIVGRLSFAITNTSHYLHQMMTHYTRRSYWLPNGKSLEEIKSFQQYPVASNVITIIGSLRDWYDYRLLFEVMKEFPQITLEVYGSGEAETSIKNMIVDAPYNNVKLMGSVSCSEMPRLTVRSLIGIIPLMNNELNRGTLPIKLFDYWAAGKAIIVTPTDELKNIGQGCLVFASTLDEWVGSIRKLLSDGEYRRQLGGIGRQRVEQQYNYKVLAGKFLDIVSRDSAKIKYIS
jgi:glycosyltransferase involved in cell wall biosynthesis